MSRAERRRIQQPRHRREHIGELVQIDGSEHRWFEDRAAACTLLVFVDDATSRLMELRFVPSESTFAYFEALRAYLCRHGKPVAFYSDKHSIFRVSREDAASGNGMTQFGRALSELNIEILCANTVPSKPPSRICALNRLTPMRLGRPAVKQRDAKAHAADRVQSPTARAIGLLSSTGRNAAGESNPLSGCLLRHQRSLPLSPRSTYRYSAFAVQLRRLQAFSLRPWNKLRLHLSQPIREVTICAPIRDVAVGGRIVAFPWVRG